MLWTEHFTADDNENKGATTVLIIFTELYS